MPNIGRSCTIQACNTLNIGIYSTMTVVNNDRNSTRGLCTRLHTSPVLFPKESQLHISGFRIQRFPVFVPLSPVFTPDYRVTIPVGVVRSQS